MTVPIPTPIFRIIHIDNLLVCLERGGLYAPNYCPEDGLPYHTIHSEEVQSGRHITNIPCGPGGTIHDYVPFYFGYLSPMLLKLKTGQVAGYIEGQEPILYLVSTAQAVRDSGARFVFSNGHGLATFTDWFDDLARLDQVDWDMVYERYWRDTVDDSDRQRRKQAEFLVRRFCEWSLIREIGVINQAMKTRVEEVFQNHPAGLRRPVTIKPDWYYY
jgi:hypothetical protein